VLRPDDSGCEATRVLMRRERQSLFYHKEDVWARARKLSAAASCPDLAVGKRPSSAARPGKRPSPLPAAYRPATPTRTESPLVASFCSPVGHGSRPEIRPKSFLSEQRDGSKGEIRPNAFLPEARDSSKGFEIRPKAFLAEQRDGSRGLEKEEQDEGKDDNDDVDEPSDSEVHILNWSCPVDHAAITCIRVQLVHSVRLTKKAFEPDVCPRCSIKVWTQGGLKGGKLFHCRGSICPKNALNSLHIAWWGRALQFKGNASGDEWKYVKGTDGPSMAQALLGLLASIGGLFGVRTLTLDAEDNGTGKLVEYYRRMGFERVGPIVPGENQMKAPLEVVAKLAPQAWHRLLVPDTFDAWKWFWSDVGKQTTQDVLEKLGVPQKWSWKVDWPMGAGVDVRIRCGRHKLDSEVTLRSNNGTELAFARGALRLKHHSLKVLWMGRSHSQAVHHTVKGRPVHVVKPVEGSRFQGKQDVTSVVALLGVLAVLGRWFGVTNVDLMAFDDGSGKLVSYFCDKLCFNKPATQDSTTGSNASDPVNLTASCIELRERCCPVEWREKLPPDSQLAMLCRVTSDY